MKAIIKTPYPLVLTKQYQKQAPLWLESLRREESVSVLFFPKTDRLRRFQQLMDDSDLLVKYLGRKYRYIFEIIDLSTVNIEEYFDLQDYLTRYVNYERIVPTLSKLDDCVKYLKKKNLRLVLVLHEAEKYLNPTNKRVLDFVSKLITDYNPYITVFCLFELDITHPSILPLLPSTVSLYDNLFYYPVYTQDEAFTFIRYLQKKWSIKINPKIESGIVEKCGGHFWLLKEAGREVATNGKWAIDGEGIHFRLNAIYQSLLSSEQSLVEKIAFNNKNLNSEEKQSLAYFKKMKIVGLENKFLIPLLESFVRDHRKVNAKFVLDGNHIVLNQIPIENFFSRKESRVLRILLEQRQQIINREEIGKRIWPIETDKNYSDWAIDQIIARVRKRLTSLSLPSSIIQSIRGKGYRFNLP